MQSMLVSFICCDFNTINTIHLLLLQESSKGAKKSSASSKADATGAEAKAKREKSSAKSSSGKESSQRKSSTASDPSGSRRRWVCIYDGCEHNARTQNDLRAHAIEAHHNGVDCGDAIKLPSGTTAVMGAFKCPVADCDQTFFKEVGMKQHMTKAHGSEVTEEMAAAAANEGNKSLKKSTASASASATTGATGDSAKSPSKASSKRKKEPTLSTFNNVIDAKKLKLSNGPEDETEANGDKSDNQNENENA